VTTGTVDGIGTYAIIIDAKRYSLGETKTHGIEKGMEVEYEEDLQMSGFLSKLAPVKKGDVTPPAAATKPAATKKNAAEEPLKKCVMGECSDKNNHFVFNRQRNRWECSLLGVDNAQISNCPLVPKKPAAKGKETASVDEKLKKSGFDTPTEPPAPVKKRVAGIYVDHDKKAIMLSVNGKNEGYPVGKELLTYLCSKNCQAVKGQSNVSIELTDYCDGKGFIATGIGPADPEPVTAAANNHEVAKAPAQQGPPKEDPPAGQRTAARSVHEGCCGCSPNDKDNDCGYCSELGQEETTIVMHRDIPQAVNPAQSWSNDELILIRNTIAKGCTEPEFKLLMYLARTYGLDPLAKQIWAVKRNDRDPALIFAGRDGLLAIAHRSGKFDGMQSGVDYEGEGKDRKPKSAWCEIWRKDMSHSFKAEVPFSEYNTGYSVWKSNPSAMIIKVAEAVCLRKAFVISGLYSPEEIDTEGGKERA